MTEADLSEADGAELSLRALRLVSTRVGNLLGEVTAEEVVALVALELREVDDGLALVGAVTAIGATTIVMMSSALGLEPEQVIARVRTMVVPIADG